MDDQQEIIELILNGTFVLSNGLQVKMPLSIKISKEYFESIVMEQVKKAFPNDVPSIDSIVSIYIKDWSGGVA